MSRPSDCIHERVNEARRRIRQERPEFRSMSDAEMDRALNRETLARIDADLAAFRSRRVARPHVHACTECYQDDPCGLDCARDRTTAEDEARSIERGAACVCGLCLRAAGLPADTFCTELPTAGGAS